ncbi:unnamed protein product [Linum tenue]|uniref:Uncharacterized protein n=1 Tax=Linum tenue TaxID=586396 RepID=A0AAV0NZY6_9ROSI|nr:unnamed protein product [Linum tenue]
MELGNTWSTKTYHRSASNVAECDIPQLRAHPSHRFTFQIAPTCPQFIWRRCRLIFV